METLYIVPNILHLKTTLEDCKSIEDLFDDLLMDKFDCDDEPRELIYSYDKIPKVFTTLKAWPKSTNLKCWSCDFVFDAVPVFVPLGIKESGTGMEISVLGNMCSFPCAALYINTHYNKQKAWTLMDNLCFLFKLYKGKYVDQISTSPPKTILQAYGGSVEPGDYRATIEKLEKEILDQARSY